MRVLLINPPFNRYGGIEGHGGNTIPLNLCYLASFVRDSNPDFFLEILDSEISGLSHEDTVEKAINFNPDCIGITTNTGVFDSVISLSFLLKEKLPDVPIVLGGPHASALPEQSLQETKADFVVIGEGEITFAEILRYIKSKKYCWHDIRGLSFRDENGTIRINEKRELISDLDIIPFPARDLVNTDLYKPPPTKRVSLGKNTLISTSRGCPYNCGFCSARTVWTRKVRARKPEMVVAEMKECIQNFNIRSFNFTDEFFTANTKRVLEICRLIKESKLNISWVCSARAQNLDFETLKAMKESGCQEISFGIESGNQDILNQIDKKLDLKEAIKVINLTKKAGISTHASYILGYINETEKTMDDTIRFAKKLNTHIAAFFIASPLPGTELYFQAKTKGYIRPDATWADYSPLSNSESVLMLPDLSIEKIREWHRKAIKGYYFRLRYILFRLLSIRHWYEIANMIGGLKIFFNIKK